MRTQIIPLLHHGRRLVNPVSKQHNIITEFAGLYKRRDPEPAERYCHMLADHGITVLRLMMEYCQGRQHYFEQPVGRCPFPEMIHSRTTSSQCPAHRPARAAHARGHVLDIESVGQPSVQREERRPGAMTAPACCCAGRPTGRRRAPELRHRAMGRQRACSRGTSWNQIHPAFAHDSAECLNDFIGELSEFVRAREMQLFGQGAPADRLGVRPAHGAGQAHSGIHLPSPVTRFRQHSFL